MRLLNTDTLELSRLFTPGEVPDYVILSHRWSTEEVTFADISKARISNLQSQTRTKVGFPKIQGACNRAFEDGYEWIWIDSCCIDKSSSAELQEAINSMWRYYAESNICYAYMADVPNLEAGWGEAFSQSEWFKRGWTLQELIAPVFVEFYTQNWEPIGTKLERHQEIAEITSINPNVLAHKEAVDLFSIAEKLSWVAHRKVTREEDEAYSLLGLFDINMPLLYGEGRGKAFVRLQEAIFNATADHSIFLFRHSLHINGQPLLADSPTRFCERIDCASCRTRGIQCLPSEFQYTDIITSTRWSTQAHEQIMTTVTSLRNEMSTTLSLLNYRDISDKLKYFDNNTPPASVTHVAVLNYTLQRFPQGALCLLLRRRPGLDACLRLPVFPVILPQIGDLVSSLEKAKLLICPGPTSLESKNRIDNMFTFESKLFRVEAWSATGSIAQSVSAQARTNSCFEIQTRKFTDLKLPMQVSCRIVSRQGPSLPLSVKLIQLNDIWSIKEVFMRKEGNREQKLRQLFHSSTLADRCSFHLPDGRLVLVRVRRLSGSARARHEYRNLKIRYGVSVEPSDR